MSESTLAPDNLPAGNDRSLGRGHGTRALGPSDSSDSGSDVQGAPGLGAQAEEEQVAPADGDTWLAERTAGPDLGDADLDSDSDSGGTGERAAAGRDSTAPDGGDIDVDHIESIPILDADVEAEVERAGRRR